MIRLIENISDNFKNTPQELRLIQSFNETKELLTSNLLHATGLVFGHTHHHLFCNFEEEEGWNLSDHIKIGVTESLLAISLNHKRSTPETVATDITDSIDLIFSFYQAYTPSKLKKSLLDFSKEKSIDEKLELTINNRLSNSSILQKKFWKGSIFNTFIYLDILYFSYWLDNENMDNLPSLEDIKVLILETIIAATWCDGVVNKGNKILLYYFLSSAILSKENQEMIELRAIRGISIDEIEYPRLPIIYKEIILKSALISILNDKEISEKESKFLDILISKLQLSRETLNSNIVQTQSFVFKYFDEVTYLKNKSGYEIVSKGFMRNFSSIIRKNKANIVKEVSESKELVELLWKAKNKSLTAEEKVKVKEQITDILRTIPSLAIFMIPGGTVLLPIILKILPDELLIPSSFRN